MSMSEKLTALYGRVYRCNLCTLGTKRVQLVPLHGVGCRVKPNVMFVAINPSPRNATIQPDWDEQRLAWVPVKKRKPKFWELLTEAGLFTVTPELQEKILNHLAEAETVEEIVEALQKNRIFLTELVKCPTRGQKDLKELMIDTCSSTYLSEEIRLTSPMIICTWGRLPFASLTGSSERLGDVIDRLDRLESLHIEDLPLTTEEFGHKPCYPCYFHLQAPVSDDDKVRHLERLRSILARA